MSHQPRTPSAPHPITAVTHLPRGNGELVLVVDDDPVQRRLAGRVLGQLGYSVEAASSGEEALSIAAKGTYSVILLDMVMDGIDGAETLQRLRKLDPMQPVILFSGFASDDRVSQAMLLGAREFLAKPVRIGTLAYAMQRALHPTAIIPSPEG